MLRQELNTYKKQQELEKSRREFNSRVNQILNNQNHHQILPTTNEVKIIEKVSSEFENLKSQNLTEIRRFLNISTQLSQLSKSKTNLDFCLKYDPNNLKLKEKSIEINSKIKSNLPTIPTTIGDELKTNLFLRCNDYVIKHALNLKDAPDQEIFTKLRDLKDAF